MDWFSAFHLTRAQAKLQPVKGLWILLALIGLAAAAPAEDAVATVRDTRDIEGWQVHLNRELLEKSPDATAKALELLRGQLQRIVRDLPKPAVARLREVPLWFSPEYTNTPPTAEYHPGAGWLRDHGRDPIMAKGVEFTNVRTFEAECRRMPVLVLHELSHAYHDRFLEGGFDNPEIRAAYERAKASGSYDKVERRDGKGGTSRERAYAMTNPQEYFAELTEAFFGTNDFQPYNRTELEQLDPAMIPLLQRLWSLPLPAPAGAAATVAPRPPGTP